MVDDKYSTGITFISIFMKISQFSKAKFPTVSTGEAEVKVR
jgi:hypothetical protein